MKAIVCTRLGGPDDLEYLDIPDPVAGPGEAVVRVHAASLNFFDTLVIAGNYQVKPKLPFSLASEFAGTVESIGPGVTAVKVGDRVTGGGSVIGATRERIAVDASQLIVIPDKLDFDRAAGLAATYGTSLHGLRDRGKLKAGETLAVLGAAGGIGIASVEIGKMMGARVIACVSSDEKAAFARRHGADETVNYSKENLKDALKKLGGDHGIDVICDPIGGDYAEPALRAIAWQGRYLIVGFAAGYIPKIALNLPLLKGCDVLGVIWGEHNRRNKNARHEMVTELVQLCAEGKLSSHVHAVYSLEQTPQALKDIAARKVMGKAIVRL